MTNPYADSTLKISLSAIADNYRLLNKTGGKSAAVVKANAYGLGVEKVAPAIAKAGCSDFFVANLDEAIELRGILPKSAIYVFHGIHKGQEKIFREYKLIPVLNSMEQVKLCTAGKLSGVLHFDTGMNRLGMSQKDAEYIAENVRLDIKYIMSHLACADVKGDPKNKEQLAAIKKISQLFPKIPVSFANSSGIFLGNGYHFDMVRPGSALYGVNPKPWTKNPMKPVVLLSGKILQIREIDTAQTVGYGASCKLPAGSKIAVLPVGYADGYLRSLGNKAFCAIGGKKVPLVGRVSMDLITIDVSKIKDIKAGSEVELIGNNMPVDDVAEKAGTIGYEILTSLGSRYKRVYQDGAV